jgi:hypothetical protein
METIEMDDASEHEWLRFARTGGAFDGLADPREDISTSEDGKPFIDPG